MVLWYCVGLTSTHYGGHEDIMHDSLGQSKVDTAVVEINLNTILVKLQSLMTIEPT